MLTCCMFETFQNIEYVWLLEIVVHHFLTQKQRFHFSTFGYSNVHSQEITRQSNVWNRSTRIQKCNHPKMTGIDFKMMPTKSPPRVCGRPVPSPVHALLPGAPLLGRRLRCDPALVCRVAARGAPFGPPAPPSPPHPRGPPGLPSAAGGRGCPWREPPSPFYRVASRGE